MAFRDVLMKKISQVEGRWQVESFDSGKDYKFIRNGTEYHVLVNLPEKVREGEAKPNVTIEVISSKPEGRIFVTYFKVEEDGKVSFRLESENDGDSKTKITVSGDAKLGEITRNGRTEKTVTLGNIRYTLPETLSEEDVLDFENLIEGDPDYNGFILPIEEIEVR